MIIYQAAAKYKPNTNCDSSQLNWPTRSVSELKWLNPYIMTSYLPSKNDQMQTCSSTGILWERQLHLLTETTWQHTAMTSYSEKFLWLCLHFVLEIQLKRLIVIQTRIIVILNSDGSRPLLLFPWSVSLPSQVTYIDSFHHTSFNTI